MKAAGGAAKGGLGWAILAAALAVPGFLFYNWWSHLKTDRDHSISSKASKRADGGVFQTPPPSAGRLINPMASSTSAPAGIVPVAPVVAAAPPPPTSGGTRPARAIPATTMFAGATPSAAAATVALSTSSTIVLPRDPMMSPMDAVRLQEAALAEEERQRELERARHPHVKRAVKVVQKPIESHIELQGISSTPDGDNLAMINDSRVRAGESFSLRNYPGKIRVLKITETEVTLDYKGRKFKMRVNAE